MIHFLWAQFWAQSGNMKKMKMKIGMIKYLIKKEKEWCRETELNRRHEDFQAGHLYPFQGMKKGKNILFLSSLFQTEKKRTNALLNKSQNFNNFREARATYPCNQLINNHLNLFHFSLKKV